MAENEVVYNRTLLYNGLVGFVRNYLFDYSNKKTPVFLQEPVRSRCCRGAGSRPCRFSRFCRFLKKRDNYWKTKIAGDCVPVRSSCLYQLRETICRPRAKCIMGRGHYGRSRVRCLHWPES